MLPHAKVCDAPLSVKSLKNLSFRSRRANRDSNSNLCTIEAAPVSPASQNPSGPWETVARNRRSSRVITFCHVGYLGMLVSSSFESDTFDVLSTCTFFSNAEMTRYAKCLMSRSFIDKLSLTSFVAYRGMLGQTVATRAVITCQWRRRCVVLCDLGFSRL